MVVDVNTLDYESEADVYVRVSSEDQQERETIENQIEFATKYCDLHKIRIREWYRDDGITGTIPMEQRDDGKRLIEDANAGRTAKLLLIYNMKRLGRKARVTLDAIDQFEKCGVMVRSMTEPFDTGTPVGRFIITVLAGQAELDRDTTLEVMWHGANRAARKGKWLGGIVPYGYRVNEERFLEINEDPLPGKEDLSEAGVIRMMYHLLIKYKWSTIKVADYLNALGVPPSYVKDGRKVKKGKRKENTAGIWTPSRIGNMIKNPTYKGLHIYGKRTKKDRELIERQVPPIVSEEDWDLAQHTLRENQLEAVKNSKRNYLLRGMIKCGSCGITYQGTAYSGAGKKPKVYYICGGKTAYKGPTKGKCTSKNIPAAWIEQMVWDECVEFICNPGDTLQSLSSGIQDQNSFKLAYDTERQMVIKASLEKEQEKQSILELYRKKIITESDVEIQLHNIALEREALEKRKREIDRLIESQDELNQYLESAEDLLTSLREKIDNDPPFEIRREIIKKLVKEIIINTTPSGDEPDKQRTYANAIFTFAKSTLLHEPLSVQLTTLTSIERSAPMPFGIQISGDTQGDRLKSARLSKFLTIQELASKTGLDQVSISNIERNKTVPTPPSIRKLAKALNVPIHYLGCFETLPEQTLQEKIKKARLYYGLTKVEAATQFKVDVKTFGDWERGRHSPQDRVMGDVLDFLQVLSG